LGLTIFKALALKLGNKNLDLISEENEGTTLKFSIFRNIEENNEMN
jgi:hypothetical protein